MRYIVMAIPKLGRARGEAVLNGYQFSQALITIDRRSCSGACGSCEIGKGGQNQLPSSRSGGSLVAA